ncbi:Protein of unknown function [Gryllus bimaculatus]|nr:Protein of unknown function [Gryllus bimaculatus]
MRMRRMSVVFWKSYSRLKWICPTFSTGSLLSMYMSTSEMERLCRNAIWGQGGTGVSACGRAQTQGLAAVLRILEREPATDVQFGSPGILLESATETSKYAPSNLMRCKNSVISHSPTARSTYQEQYKILPFAQISSK